MPGFGSLGGTELIIALVIILLLFGAKRIPELAKGLGSGVREFRKGTRGEGEVEEEEKDAKGEELTAGINQQVEVATLKRIAMKNGMKTLHQDSMLKVKEGLTTLDEALSNVPPDLIL